MSVPALTTCCAHCRTKFRVTAAQLQAHAGQVRCGRCMQVFNALAALAPEPAPVEVEVRPESASSGGPVSESVVVETSQGITPFPPETEPETAPEAADIETETQTVEPVPELPVPEPMASAAAHADAVIASSGSADALPDAGQPDVVAATGPELQEAADPVETRADDGTGAPIDAHNPFVDAPAAEQPADPRRRRFAVASAVMASILAAQAVFFYRSEIAARYPPVREWLGALCVQAGCTVTLPQRPQSILIEASDLQVTDPANPNRIQLTATLRNHAGHDVGYPALDLVLTNVNDHTLARRIFLPEDYLGAGRDPRGGIAANAEMTVRLALETGNLGAAGFRLAVLPAPGR